MYLRRQNVTFIEPHMWPQTARTWIQSIALLGCLSTDGLSTLTIQDNQPAKAINRHCVGQTCWNVSTMAPLASGVTGLSGSSRSKADKLSIWRKKTAACQLLQTITETINTLFPVVNFFKICCYWSRLVFNCCFETLDISQGSAATHLRCGRIFSDSIIARFLLILTVKKFLKSANIWWSQGVQKNCAIFWATQYIAVTIYWRFFVYFWIVILSPTFLH